MNVAPLLYGLFLIFRVILGFGIPMALLWHSTATMQLNSTLLCGNMSILRYSSTAVWAVHEPACFEQLLLLLLEGCLCLCCRLSQCSQFDDSSCCPEPGVGACDSAGPVIGELQSQPGRQLQYHTAQHDYDCQAGCGRQHHRCGHPWQQLWQALSAVPRHKWVSTRLRFCMATQVLLS